MVDRTISTVDPTLITETERISTQLNIPRHDSQIEINNYYINCIDDSLIQSELKPSEAIDDPISKPIINESSCQLEISQLPEEIFIDENIQCEFECIFHEFDPEVIISYSNIFQRAYLTFSDPILAFQVCTNMNEKEFHSKKLHISSSIEYLQLPKYERIYMQSPPTTPPIGWVAQREELPEINFDLFLALSKLQPNEPLEILPKQNYHPAIIIHPCSDTSDDDDDVINPIIDEFGNKKYTTMEAKRRAHILHDAILVPGEQQIRRSTGDGDKLISNETSSYDEDKYQLGLDAVIKRMNLLSNDSSNENLRLAHEQARQRFIQIWKKMNTINLYIQNFHH